MIKYRPQRGSLSLSLKEERIFDTVDDMKQHVFDEWRRACDFLGGKPPFTMDDIVIGEIIGDDSRIGWKNVRHVCIRRLLGELYRAPQCIGWCGE